MSRVSGLGLGLDAWAVSEATARSEQHRTAHKDVYDACKKDLYSLLRSIADEERISSTHVLISSEGVAQIAGSLPRTMSDLLRVDTMNEHKLLLYGEKIMGVLRPHWNTVDAREHAKIEQELHRLKDKSNMVSGLRVLPPMDNEPPDGGSPARFKGGRGGGRRGSYGRHGVKRINSGSSAGGRRGGPAKRARGGRRGFVPPRKKTSASSSANVAHMFPD